MSTSKVVSGVLASLAVGAILGIIFAPNKGSETRNKIKAKRNEFMGKLKSKHTILENSVSDQFDSVTEEASHLAKRARKKFKNTVKDIPHNG